METVYQGYDICTDMADIFLYGINKGRTGKSWFCPLVCPYIPYQVYSYKMKKSFYNFS